MHMPMLVSLAVYSQMSHKSHKTLPRLYQPPRRVHTQHIQLPLIHQNHTPRPSLTISTGHTSTQHQRHSDPHVARQLKHDSCPLRVDGLDAAILEANESGCSEKACSVTYTSTADVQNRALTMELRCTRLVPSPLHL
mmetsp:Transcript_17282/g.49068  ORF Transcript_17282/g.49068 Transcript_17282/m.49068 type:complete len:137 (-) Transcript_17282:328-738(-)